MLGDGKSKDWLHMDVEEPEKTEWMSELPDDSAKLSALQKVIKLTLMSSDLGSCWGILYQHLSAFTWSNTVLSGAEERRVQRRSLAPFLIFSIPADLRSYLRSKGLA